MALGSVPLKRLKIASALFNGMRNFAGAVGIALANILLNRWVNLHRRLNEKRAMGGAELNVWLARMTSYAQATAADPSLALNRAVAVLVRLARRESATMAFCDALLMMAALFLAGLLAPLIKLDLESISSSRGSPLGDGVFG